MLREIKNSFVGARLIPYSWSTTGGAAAVLDTGKADFRGSAISAAAGLFQYALLVPAPYRGAAARGAVAVGQNCWWTGGFTINSEPLGQVGNTTYPITQYLLNGSAVADNGQADGLICVWDGGDVVRRSPQIVTCSQDRTRLIWGSISSSGTVPVGGTDFSVSKTGTGDYTVTFKRAFGRAPRVFVTPVKTTGEATSRVVSRTAASARVVVFDNTNTAADTAFWIVVVGTDSSAETRRLFAPILNSQRKPRLVAGSFTDTPTAVVGNGDFTVAKNGTGDYTVTFTDAFKRAPAVLACSSSTSRCVQIHTVGATSVRLLTYDGAGSAAGTAGHVSFMAFGSDDSVEY